MNYLVDTNVLSEPQQKIPSLKVIEWLRHHEAQLYTSTIVIAEIAYGIDDLPASGKRTRLENWLKETLRLSAGCAGWAEGPACFDPHSWSSDSLAAINHKGYKKRIEPRMTWAERGVHAATALFNSCSHLLFGKARPFLSSAV